MMKIRSKFQSWLLQEDLNFLLTNRIPRIAVTRFMGWWSQLRHPWIVKGSIAVWRWFTDLDLSEAKEKSFDSIHACFTRELVAGARPYSPDPQELASPCDAIVGAMGQVEAGTLLQAKGFPYTLQSLMGSAALAQRYAQHCYITLRLTSSMYHRFHAPGALTLDHVTYISGDTWNVNPIALKRVERLFCRNERAVIEARLQSDGTPLLLVPVAAILVASIRLHFLDVVMNMNYRGAADIACATRVRRGEELGWFEHGSTIIVFAPRGFRLCDGIAEGTKIRMGQRLMVLP